MQMNLETLGQFKENFKSEIYKCGYCFFLTSEIIATFVL